MLKAVPDYTNKIKKWMQSQADPSNIKRKYAVEQIPDLTRHGLDTLAVSWRELKRQDLKRRINKASPKTLDELCSVIGVSSSMQARICYKEATNRMWGKLPNISTPAKRKKVLELHTPDMTLSYISKKVGLHISVVHRIIKYYG